ncbi:unnamed protein product [Boreogadus saida]
MISRKGRNQILNAEKKKQQRCQIESGVTGDRSADDRRTGDMLLHEDRELFTTAAPRCGTTTLCGRRAAARVDGMGPLAPDGRTAPGSRQEGAHSSGRTGGPWLRTGGGPWLQTNGGPLAPDRRGPIAQDERGAPGSGREGAPGSRRTGGPWLRTNGGPLAPDGKDLCGGGS